MVSRGFWTVFWTTCGLASVLATSVAADGPQRLAMSVPDAIEATPYFQPEEQGDIAPVEAGLHDVSTDQIEVVTERFPDGTVKIQREVTLDEGNNYVNHGSYTMYDKGGRVVRTGEYRVGKLQGEWMQIFEAGEGDLFSGDMNKEFHGPFVSTATFLDGQLHGTWTITGGSEQKIIEWNFDRGVRHGLATWWHPTGAKRYEVTYENGIPVGEVVQWGADGKRIGATKYIDGRPLVNKVKWYDKNQKEYEGTVLAAQDLDQPQFDWWTTSAKIGPSPVKIPELKHGAWSAWFQNGQKKVQGTYDQGVPVGHFTWWYENGQKQAEGDYEDGLQVGTWITWHANGMKQSMGEYSEGQIVGKWMRWEPTGKLVEIRDFNAATPVETAAESADETDEHAGIAQPDSEALFDTDDRQTGAIPPSEGEDVFNDQWMEETFGLDRAEALGGPQMR